MKALKRYWPLLIPLALMIIYLCLRQGCGDPYVWRFLITPACLGIVLWSCIEHRNRTAGILICLAFLLCIVGDLCLHNSGKAAILFMIGLGFFLLAHVCFITFSLKNGKMNWLVLGIVVTIYLVYYFAFLMPGLEGIPLKAGTLAYLLVSCVSVGAAAGLRTDKTTKGLYLAGIICIVVSDTQISIHNFLQAECLYWAMLPLYYAFQMLVTAAIIHLNSTKA
jgi:uncharacterized membrane protein YhhN